jgi:hypothetical protein
MPSADHQEYHVDGSMYIGHLMINAICQMQRVNVFFVSDKHTLHLF